MFLILTGRFVQPFDKQELSLSAAIPAHDAHFFLEAEGNVVAVARFVKVDGVYIGNKKWPAPVWGRSLVAVLPEFWGKGYGKAITVAMVQYGKEHNMSQVGIHGKRGFVARNETKPSLTSFYGGCGLEVDELLGARFYAPKNGELKDLAHTNISYFKGDPFICAVKEVDYPVRLPFRW